MRPSVGKIIWNDWIALFSALGVPIAWCIHLAFPHLRNGATSPLVLAVSFSALALAVLAWRVARVKALFVSQRCLVDVIERL
jgi:hypothetical protein